MKRFLTCFLIFAGVLFSAVTIDSYALPGPGEGGKETQRLLRIGEALGIDLSAGTLVSYEDTHGGFHGDGQTFAVVELAGMDGELKDAPGWKPLPMSENAAQAIDLCGGAGASVRQGYYYLYDYQGSDPYDDTGLHSRYSWNFAAAVYGSGNGRLYFYQFDT